MTPPEITLIGLTLTGGDVNGNGGAIRSEARLEVRDCIIMENEANVGGAIYVEVLAGGTTTREALRIEDSVIDHNVAGSVAVGGSGGGVAIVSAAANDTVLITGTTISHNIATLNGGGVYADLNGAHVTISDSNFILNEAASGGGIYALLDDMASFTVDATELEENDASLGAGLYAELTDQSRLDVEGSTFYDNEATTDGGGIYAELRGVSTLELTNTSLEINDSIQGDGGGLYADVESQSTLLIQHSMFDRNEASLEGGGVYTSADGGSFVEVVASVFEENDASSAGGGVRVELLGGASAMIRQTRFELNAAGGGGGMYFHVSSASVQIDESEFVNNDATGSGGGIYAELDDGASVEIVDSDIDLNEAALFGGGGVYGFINSGADAVLEIRESRITGNIATDGGGVLVDLADHDQADGSVFNLQQSFVVGNRAANRGGGILTKVGAGGQVTVNDSVITGNDAGIALVGGQGDVLNAGGMYAFLWTGLTVPMLTISGSEFSENTAGQHGGGLALCTKRDGTSTSIPRLSVYNTTFSGNQAGYTTSANDPGKGGGVYLALLPAAGLQKLEAHFQNTTITDNIADQGGGVWSFEPNPSTQSVNDVWLTNSIASANKKHNGLASNLWGSFNVPLTVFNIIGSGNSIWDHVNDAPATLRNDPAGGNIFTDDPKLAELEWNGGPTRTHRPLGDSLAIDRGSNERAIIPFTDVPPNPGMPLMTDQRGENFPRIHDVPGTPDEPDPGETVDIGAYEVGLAKVIDVVLKGIMPDGQPWERDAYSFAEIVPTGEQMAPIFTQGVNKIEIHFSEDVRKAGGEDLDESVMTLFGTERHFPAAAVDSVASTFGYNNQTLVASWTYPTTFDGQALNSGLPADKYRIEIGNGLVEDQFGRSLDGLWEHDTGQILDDWTDDIDRNFPSGNDMGGSRFQFLFSLMPGDYDQNGVVDTGDYTVWQNDESHADGDGDGTFGQQGDYDVWDANFDRILPLHGTRNGDFDNDEMVGMPDYTLWRVTYGSTMALEADGNRNGIVDLADYTIWQAWNGTEGPWYTTTHGIGTLVPVVDMVNPPTVMNVTISGSNSLHSPYSFAGVAGDGDQLRTVPVGGADTISIAFSEDVNVAASNLQVIGLRTANVAHVIEFSYDIASMTATWRFSDLVANDHYIIALSDAVTDIEGNRLDGEWINPATLATTSAAVSEFPSGDGQSGGHFNFVVTLLAGDANLDLFVNSTDFSILTANWGTVSGMAFVQGDFSGDGGVTDVDLSGLGGNWQLDLSAPIWLLADLDGDHDVDDADMDILGDNIGMASPTRADGDLNGDGVIDNADLDLMFAQYGMELEAVA
jgi:hypothetical protein